MAAVMTSFLGNNFTDDPKAILANSIWLSGPHILHALAPIMLVLAGAAILIVGLQVGFHANLQVLIPNPAKLNPLRGNGPPLCRGSAISCRWA